MFKVSLLLGSKIQLLAILRGNLFCILNEKVNNEHILKVKHFVMLNFRKYQQRKLIQHQNLEKHMAIRLISNKLNFQIITWY